MAASSRRFYWLKLPADFFDRFDIRYIRAQPDGDKVVVLYLKLLLRAVSTDGRIDLRDVEDDPAGNLALFLGEDIGTMEKALSLLQKFKLIEAQEPGRFYLRELKKMVGTETGAAERMRRMRQKKKEEKLQKENTEVTPSETKEKRPCSPVLQLRYDAVTDSYTEKE